MGSWVDYLFKFIKNVILFFQGYGPLKIYGDKNNKQTCNKRDMMAIYC